MKDSQQCETYYAILTHYNIHEGFDDSCENCNKLFFKIYDGFMAKIGSFSLFLALFSLRMG